MISCLRLFLIVNIVFFFNGYHLYLMATCRHYCFVWSNIREFAHSLWNVKCVKEYLNRWRSQSRDAKLGKSGTKKLEFGSLWSFFGSDNFLVTLLVLWQYFGSILVPTLICPKMTQNCLNFLQNLEGKLPGPPISDYFFYYFTNLFLFWFQKNVFFGSKSKNLLTTLFSQSVIRSAHFCTETDYWFTVTFTDLGILLHIPHSTTNARTLYFQLFKVNIYACFFLIKQHILFLVWKHFF